MKTNKIIIGKTIMAAAVATSVFAVSNPADATSVSKAEKAVVKAEKLAKTLKLEISIENRKKQHSKNLAGYPNMKIFNATKAALVEAKKAVATVKGNEKTIFEARLSANVSTYINQTSAYIDAVSTGLKIQKQVHDLQMKYNKGEVDSTTEGMYYDLSRNLKKIDRLLIKVQGISTKLEFNKVYKQPAEKLIRAFVYPVSIKVEIERSEKALKEHKPELAAAHLGNVSYLLNEASKKGFKVQSKVFKGALAHLKITQSNFSKQASLFVASSAKASAPTTFGPTKGIQALNHNVYVYAGVNEQIKLKNMSINGNLVVLGSPKGAGNVYLENVKVNRVNSNGGSIVVQDVADHSLHLKKVTADSLVVNDTNGSNIVADDSVKIGTLFVTEHAASKGLVTIESKARGSFSSIVIASKGSSASQGVNFKGNFETTTITVTGANSKVAASKGAAIKDINLKAAAAITVANGAVIDVLKKDPSVKGEVKVDNKGIVKEADSTIKVIGNKPVVVTNPSPVIIPALTGFSAHFASGKSVEGSNNRLEILASRVADNEVFTGVTFNTNPASAVKLQITSLSARNTNFLNSPMEYDLSKGTTITTKDLFGNLDTGAPGITLQNLRAIFLNEDITLKGKLISEASNGGQSQDITIVINLGNGEPVSTFSNEFATITKKGIVDSKHKIEVVLNPDKLSTKLGDVYSPSSKIDFAQLLVSFAASSLAFPSDVVPANVDELRKAISNPDVLNNVTLGQLKGKTFNTSSFIVEFK